MPNANGHGPKRAILYAQHNHEGKRGDTARSLTPEPVSCVLLIPRLLVTIKAYQH